VIAMSKRQIVSGLVAAVLCAAAGFWLLTAPAVWHVVRGSVPVATGPARLENGQTLFWAGGCASCHATPDQDDRLRLGGGRALPTPFGTFRVPNLSSDTRDGIGAWSEPTFIAAMREGVSPDGRHYYPAFPYTSYALMNDQDLVDLLAFLKTLPPVSGRIADHDLHIPFSFRRGLGLWKWLNMAGGSYQPQTGQSDLWNRGAYLVNGPGHCAECHSPRDVMGGIRTPLRLSGGPDPEGGAGYIPNLTSHPSGLAKWTGEDIAEFLKTGFTPNFDSAGGSMASVIKNMGHLEDADRMAIATYLKSLPPLPSNKPAKKTP
jgi:mono/diheme cytochrome c family protein